MNILLAFSSHDGPSWLAFNTDSLNLELEHHRNINDAINFSREQQKKEKYCERTLGKKFGEDIEVVWGEITATSYIIEDVLRGEAQFADEESDEYDARYKNITLNPPFLIDEVFKIAIFV